MTYRLLAATRCSRPPSTRELRADARTTAAGPRLYILDCGDIKPMDPTLFGLKKEEIAGDAQLRDALLSRRASQGHADLGRGAGSRRADSRTTAPRSWCRTSSRRGSKLLPQLQQLGYTPADITYLAMSHYHLDHTANANLFAGSTWIVQQAEYDAMFGAKEFAIRDASSLRQAQGRQTHHAEQRGPRCVRRRHGDHQDRARPHARPPDAVPALKNFGPLLLEGDLYHLPEERTLDRVPTFDFDAAMTRATRVKTEAFLKETGAQMWIQHDPPTNAKLRKAPEFYD